MGYIRTKTSSRNFAGQNRRIKEQIIDPAALYIRTNGAVPKKAEGADDFRIDVTDETHTLGKKQKEEVVKIQVQKGKDTYASVTIRKSAAERLETDAAIKNVIADAIIESYSEGFAYEVSYE